MLVDWIMMSLSNSKDKYNWISLWRTWVSHKILLGWRSHDIELFDNCVCIRPMISNTFWRDSTCVWPNLRWHHYCPTLDLERFHDTQFRGRSYEVGTSCSSCLMYMIVITRASKIARVRRNNNLLQTTSVVSNIVWKVLRVGESFTDLI